MFLTDSDYNAVIDADDLVVIQNGNNRNQAESRAQETISSYLRNRYNITTIFSAIGDARNTVVVGWMVDVSLYHLFAKMPGRMGYDIRKERYDQVISELEAINKGQMTPNLPLLTDSDGTPTAGPIKWGSEPAYKNHW